MFSCARTKNWWVSAMHQLPGTLTKPFPDSLWAATVAPLSGRLLRREAPQSGSGISHYQYDNNNSIHLVKLKVSSP